MNNLLNLRVKTQYYLQIGLEEIKWRFKRLDWKGFQAVGRVFKSIHIKFALSIWIMGALFLQAATAFAQSSGDNGSAKFQQSVTNLINTVKTYALISIPAITVIGFAVLIAGGLSISAKRWALGVLGLLIIGAIGLFIFADPLANALKSTAS